MKLNLISYIGLLFTLTLFNSCGGNDKKDPSPKNGKIEQSDSTEVVYDNSTLDSLSIIMENTASMDGYMNQSPGLSNIFKAVIKNINVKQEFFVANTNLHQNEKLEDAITGLKSSDWSENKGLKANHSDSRKVLEESIKKVTDNNAVIFFTDGIYSMAESEGALNITDIEGYVYRVIAHAIEENEIEIEIYKFILPFNGYYFSGKPECIDIKTKIKNGKRPIYMFLFGKHKQLKEINNNSSFKKYAVLKYKGISTKFFITKSYETVYTVIERKTIGDQLRTGNYKFGKTTDKKDKRALFHKIYSAQKIDKTFQFYTAVDFSSIGLNSDYIQNKNNYNIVESNYKIDTIISISDYSLDLQDKIKKLHPGTKFSHIIKLTSSVGKKISGDVTINLENTPAILSKKTLTDCSITTKDSLNTITFPEVMRGIKQAYDDKNKSKPLATIKINITGQEF